MVKHKIIHSLASLLAILCLSLTSLGAVQVSVQELTKHITAYKYQQFTAIPETAIYIHDMSYNNISYGADISIPTSAMLSEYPVFTWTLVGNIPNTVTLSFSISPLISSEAVDKKEWIPFTLRFVPETTLIDNIPVPAGPFFHNGIAYNYSENILQERTVELPAYTGEIPVAEAIQTVDLPYTLVTSTKPQANVTTVDHWIRNGVAYIKIGDLAQNASYGVYTSVMTVTCTAI